MLSWRFSRIERAESKGWRIGGQRFFAAKPPQFGLVRGAVRADNSGA
jgi:hypothetical protein